jgi:peptidoglycan/LPS O-acetylase OafA/YrhL
MSNSENGFFFKDSAGADGLRNPTLRASTLAPCALGYRPQLDGLRALAVATVLIQHFMPKEALPGALGNIPYGLFGVYLFFVLSGFLITAILLQMRSQMNGRLQQAPSQLRSFYLRRALRIFPLYFFVLAVAVALGASGIMDALPWLLSFTFNFQVAVQGWFPDSFAHLWTLCVEEQFYLIWPLVVLVAPTNKLIPTACALIVLGPLFRFATLQSGSSGFMSMVATPGCVDTLAIGALLALVAHRDGGRKFATVLIRIALPLGLVITVACLAPGSGQVVGVVPMAFFSLGVGIFCGAIVLRASEGFGGLLGRWLELPWLRYIGKISYGVYVYHLFVPLLLSKLSFDIAQDPHQNTMTGFIVYTMVTLFIAAISWHVMEKPINDMKRYFATANGVGTTPRATEVTSST